jgi:hypothetical protein
MSLGLKKAGRATAKENRFKAVFQKSRVR